MKVRMRTNLGSRDAAKVGLDYKNCLEGREVTVGGDAAEWLVATGKAEFVAPPVVQAVPVEPVKAVPAEPIKAIEPEVVKQPVEAEKPKQIKSEKKSK